MLLLPPSPDLFFISLELPALLLLPSPCLLVAAS
jgi:hypothetical protein